MLVLFDLDGTLTDPFPGISAGIRHAFAQVGAPSPNDDALRSMIGPPFTETFPAHGVPDHRFDEAVGHYRSVYETGGLFDATVYVGIKDVLRRLLALGHTLALATSKPTASATRVLEHFDLRSFFSFVGGASYDQSRHEKHAVIAHVLDELSPASGSVVMVGDRVYDVEGARRNGVPCIAVTWGYAEPGELDRCAPGAVAAAPADVVRHVRNHAAQAAQSKRRTALLSG